MYQYFLETHPSGGTAGLDKSNFYSTDFPFFLSFHKQTLTHTEAYLGSCQLHTMVLFIKIVNSQKHYLIFSGGIEVLQDV